MKTNIELPYNFTQRDYQIEPWEAIMEESFRRGILVWPRRNGKDLFSWNVCICKAMQRVGLYFYVAPYYNQARSIIWNGMTNDGRAFTDYIPRELIASKTKQDMHVHLQNGSQIKLHGSDNIDRIVGSNPIGIVFTEASLHKVNVWDYIRPILAANDGWALFNGTPRGVNQFYDLVERAKKLQYDLKNPWYYQYLDCEITGVPTKEAIQQDRESGMPESLIQQEYYCSFTSSTEDVLIPLDLIVPHVGGAVNGDVVKTAPRIMGVDVAFAEKGDKAVITRRQGPLCLPQEKYLGMDNMALASRIFKLDHEWRPKFICIDNGRGEGVISRLVQLGLGHKVIGVDFGGKTYSAKYHRKKDEMWGRAKEWFTNYTKVCLPDDEELIRDLSTPTFTQVEQTNKIRLESKDSMKRRGFPSTDCGDSFVLTHAEDFDLENIEQIKSDHYNQTGDFPYWMDDNKEEEYDPLNHMDNMHGSFFSN